MQCYSGMNWTWAMVSRSALHLRLSKTDHQAVCNPVFNSWQGNWKLEKGLFIHWSAAITPSGGFCKSLVFCTYPASRFRFDIEEAEYLHLTKSDLSFPLSNFSFLRCHSVLEAYKASIKNAFRKTKERGP